MLGVVRVVRVVGVVYVVRMVGWSGLVTLLVEYYFVQNSVGWWCLLLDVLFLVSPSPTRVSC